MPVEASKTRRRGAYSFGGCGNCRRRHVKCDKEKPNCLTCSAIGLSCDGFKAELTWINQKSTGSGTAFELKASSKVSLYSKSSRESMISQMQSDVVSRSVDECLAGLETQFQSTLENDPNHQVALGPFGIFQVKTTDAEANEPTPSVETTPANSSMEPQPLDSDPFPASFTSPANLEPYLDWTDLFDFDGLASRVPTSNVAQNSTDNGPTEFETMSSIVTNSSPAGPRPPSILKELDVMGNVYTLQKEQLTPEEGHMLLKHYRKETMADLWSTPLGQKSPLLIHYDAAIATLTKVTYIAEFVSHAAIANLLAVIAVSAYHLHHAMRNKTYKPTRQWQEFSELAIIEAKHHLQVSIDTEISPKGAKYKDLVMATAALASFSIVLDRQNEARAYMVDAERLLRTVGLTKRTISRKIALLHHTYTWVRIVGESTNVCQYSRGNSPSGQRLYSDETAIQYQNSWGQALQNPRIDDFLGFLPHDNICTSMNIGESENSGLFTPPASSSGLNDLHLQCGGGRSEPTFRFLYGISESWLSFLSRTTRIANIRDRLKYAIAVERDSSSDVDEQAERLEHLICNYVASTATEHSLSGDETPRAAMVQALNHALVIFFYRRVRNVNAWILQSHVSNVMRELRRFDELRRRHGVKGPGSPWPAFIAGCESLMPADKQYLGGWLEKAYVDTGFTRFDMAKRCMHEVWRRREETSRAGTGMPETWIDVSRDWKVHVLLS